MATFLDTTGISDKLNKLIKQSEKILYLVSPYLKFNKLVRQAIESKARTNTKIRIIYGKDESQTEQISWLKEYLSIHVLFCENLHAKCYINEKEAIVTSMNLYEFSQANNLEIGIYLTKEEDKELYEALAREVLRFAGLSKQIKITEQIEEIASGCCIRCGKTISFDKGAPYCKSCYSIWARYQNPNYEENYCHCCGDEEYTTMNKPLCRTCYYEHQ